MKARTLLLIAAAALLISISYLQSISVITQEYVLYILIAITIGFGLECIVVLIKYLRERKLWQRLKRRVLAKQREPK